MIDIAPFSATTRKGKTVLVLKPAFLTNIPAHLLQNLSYEIHEGRQLVTRQGWNLFGGPEQSIDISNIDSIDKENSSFLNFAVTLGAQNLIFRLTGNRSVTWYNVPQPNKVKSLILELKYNGPSYLQGKGVQENTNVIKSGEGLPSSNHERNFGTGIAPQQTYNDQRDLSTDNSIHIETLNIHNGHNFYVLDDTAIRADEKGNPIVFQERFDPRIGTNIALGKTEIEKPEKPTMSANTLAHFKKIAHIPAGFANPEDFESKKGQVVTQISIDAQGNLVTNAAEGKLKRSWDMVRGKLIEDHPKHSHPQENSTTVFYDGRFKKVFLKDGKLFSLAENDFSPFLLSGGWNAISGKNITRISGAAEHGGRIRLIAASDQQGRIYITHTTLFQAFNAAITKHGSELVYLNWRGPQYQASSPHMPGQKWLTTHLTSASLDGTIRVWDIERGQELGCFMGHNVEKPAIAENDAYFAYADQLGYVHVFERV